MREYLSDYAAVGVIILVGIFLATAMLSVNRFMRPSVPSRAKSLTYESGVDPVGSGWAQANVRCYIYAFLYVIFAVDAVFLFPWAVVFAAIGWAAAIEMAVFIGFIAVGLVYAWRMGVLSWTK